MMSRVPAMMDCQFCTPALLVEDAAATLPFLPRRDVWDKKQAKEMARTSNNVKSKHTGRCIFHPVFYIRTVVVPQRAAYHTVHTYECIYVQY